MASRNHEIKVGVRANPFVPWRAVVRLSLQLALLVFLVCFAWHLAEIVGFNVGRAVEP